MPRLRRLLIVAMLAWSALVHLSGCGATRSSDTTRTATEQLLISDAIDRAVQSMNLQALSGQTVFLDDTKLTDTVDRNYYISTLRQHLLATGCELRDKREEADFVVEARAGAIGTDRNDLLFGLPSMNVPQIPVVQPVPAVIPEIPIAKRKDQRGVAKIAVFAYHRATGTPVWQSGIVRQESSANDVWIFGAGPFQRGTIYEGTTFAGGAIKNETSKTDEVPRHTAGVSVTREGLFNSPSILAAKSAKPTDGGVTLAAHQEATPVGAATPSAAPTVPTAAPQPSAATAQAATPATKVSSAPTAAEKPALISAAKAEPSKPDTINSAYAKVGDASALPQPRFNSPQ
jgi:hypothetical protein